MGPISVCVANFLLDPWVREEVVNMVDNAVVFYGFVVFLVCAIDYYYQKCHNNEIWLFRN